MLAKELIVPEHMGKDSASNHMHWNAFICHMAYEAQRLKPCCMEALYCSFTPSLLTEAWVGSVVFDSARHGLPPVSHHPSDTLHSLRLCCRIVIVKVFIEGDGFILHLFICFLRPLSFSFFGSGPGALSQHAFLLSLHSDSRETPWEDEQPITGFTQIYRQLFPCLQHTWHVFTMSEEALHPQGEGAHINKTGMLNTSHSYCDSDVLYCIYLDHLTKPAWYVELEIIKL